MEKRNEKVKKNLPNQRKTKGNSCIIRSTEESTPSRTHQNENKEKELGHMLNKKWFTGALLGAFLGLGVITGSPQAEASALSTDEQRQRHRHRSRSVPRSLSTPRAAASSLQTPCTAAAPLQTSRTTATQKTSSASAPSATASQMIKFLTVQERFGKDTESL